MKFNIFDIKIDITLSKNRTNNKFKILKKFFNSSFTRRYIIFFTILFITSLFLLFNKYRQEYVVNEIAKHDIISTNTVTYNVNLLNDDIIKEIEESTTKEYDKNTDIANDEISKLNKFLIELAKIDYTNEVELSKIIKANSLDMSVSDIKNIASKRDFEYYLNLVEILNKIYEAGIINQDDYKKILLEKNINLSESEEKLLKNFIKSNLKLNEEKTKQRIQENIERLKNYQRTIKTGDIVVKKGQVITNSDIQALSKLGMIEKNKIIISIVASIILFLLLSLILYIPFKIFLKKAFLSKGFIPTMITLIIVNFINILSIYELDTSIYITPFYILPVLAYILTKDKLFSYAISIVTYIILINDINWLIIIAVVTIFVIYKSTIIRNRTQILKNYVELSLYQIILSIPYSIILNNTFNEASQIIILTIFVGLISAILTIGLLPFYENTFKILTDMKLLELSDTSNPLLKKLLMIAPGTFHHSLMVGALAERAAEVIGANPIFTRVASFYHDIGKMKRPQYFVENQFEHINPHDKIDPSLSANIIISHVTDGVLLARQNNLPEEIVEVIEQHHGTTLVKYFYYKAIEKNEIVDIENFKYPGPVPMKKETALIMLADSIEAAVRVQKDKRKESIEELVRYLIYNKIEEMQLSNCELTYSEIEKVIKAFLDVLQGAYHERIEYPKLQKEEK